MCAHDVKSNHSKEKSEGAIIVMIVSVHCRGSSSRRQYANLLSNYNVNCLEFNPEFKISKRLQYSMYRNVLVESVEGYHIQPGCHTLTFCQLYLEFDTSCKIKFSNKIYQKYQMPQECQDLCNYGTFLQQLPICL